MELHSAGFLSFLRITEIDASVKVFGSVPMDREWLNISSNKGAMGVENFLQNSDGRPSGPGVLPLLSSLVLVSSRVIAVLAVQIRPGV